MIVMKFGGSSVASASAIEWVAGIVHHHLERRPVVVVSAMGKTTDRLQDVYQHACRGSSYSAWRGLEDLRQFHLQETRRLLGPSAGALVQAKIEPLFRQVHGILIELEEGRKPTPACKDQVLSLGERLSSEIATAALRHNGIAATHVHAPDVIQTDSQFGHAAPRLWETYAALRRTVAIRARDSVVVMGGFIGAAPDGAVTTLGRGGSDLTASVVGAGISAEEIQIWTDVDGMLSCDPRILRGGYVLRSLGYEEAEEMAQLGAKVLYESTVAPAVRQGIPIAIRNSRHPEIEGTIISASAVRKPGTVKSVACLGGITIVHLDARDASGLAAITDGLHDLLARNGITVRFVQSRGNGVSFAVSESPSLPEVLHGVDSKVQVRVEEGMAALSLVGDGITAGDAVAARAQQALKAGQIRMVAQGSSRLSISFIVPETALPEATEALHREFFRAADREIFGNTETRRPGIANPETAGILVQATPALAKSQ
ncbi:MAG TPA: aspartate kinase [Bryobacteraceae bacterium]|nr:aspartate kinase [Bryobacteraceae bacterium]